MMKHKIKVVPCPSLALLFIILEKSLRKLGKLCCSFCMSGVYEKAQKLTNTFIGN